MLFKDRSDAGKQLSDKFPRNPKESYYIFALSKSGVFVAYELAIKLKAPLDMVISIKLKSENFPNIGFGAIAPGRVLILNDKVIKSKHITTKEVEKIKAKQSVELSKMILKYRDSKPMPDLEAKTVVIVDDGVITGDTARAAIRYLKSFDPLKIIITIPVCKESALQVLRAEADDVVFLNAPQIMPSISEVYENFPRITDKEVVDVLQRTMEF